MAKEFWTLTEVIEIFEIQRTVLVTLEEEEIICPRSNEIEKEPVYSRDEMEMLRVAKVLMDELDVNLAGVDIILRMRGQMLAMRNQFDAILVDLAEKLRDRT